jgi:hypothetical protein
MEDDIEEISKDWSADLLILAEPADMSNPDSPKTVHDTPGPNKKKKTEEVQYLRNASGKTSSISPDRGMRPIP